MIHRITSLREKRGRGLSWVILLWYVLFLTVTELSSAFCLQWCRFPCWTGFLFLRADEWSQNYIIVVIHVIDANKNTVEMNKTWFWLLWYRLFFFILFLFIFNQAWWLMVKCCYQVLLAALGSLVSKQYSWTANVLPNKVKKKKY